eukprot:14676232-Ditylum_brightwellii.AAC.1
MASFPAFIFGSNRTMTTTILHRCISILTQTWPAQYVDNPGSSHEIWQHIPVKQLSKTTLSKTKLSRSEELETWSKCLKLFANSDQLKVPLKQ